MFTRRRFQSFAVENRDDSVAIGNQSRFLEPIGYVGYAGPPDAQHLR
jgi:hypothetical protein